MTNNQLSCANRNGALQVAELRAVVEAALGKIAPARKVLVIHPDYSRNDYSHVLAPLLYEVLAERGLQQIDFLNAGGTHRKMTQDELVAKLGLREGMSKVGALWNHEFDNPEMLVHVVDIPASFVAKQTKGLLEVPMPVTVNRRITEGYDLIVAISGTVPHEAIGYSGGTKIFFPGISGPEVIALLHWAAVLMGVPEIIGRLENPAREVVDQGTEQIFARISDVPVLSLNMVYTEDDAHRAVPRGLFTGFGLRGFREALSGAAGLSSELHIIYTDRPMQAVVQQLPKMYDEVWTAGKGSYKLQMPGVLAEGGEIILYAPHIHCFHSHPRLDSDIRKIGYHGREWVVEYCRANPTFDKNVASHVINVRGIGSLVNGKEEFPFKVTLATQIPQTECEAVGLGYRDPASLNEAQFQEPDRLWIREGGQWLYARA